MTSICKRCGKIHTCPPADPKKIIEKLAKDMAREIDKEVLERLTNEITIQTRNCR